jgi:hypothetical protein
MKAFCCFIIAVLLLLLPMWLKAVSIGEVVGQVIDLETRQPVPYAEIVFENYYDKVTVTANEHGFYYGSHIPEGRYQMRVVYNQRTFVMNRVKVYDSYTNEVNFFVSCNDTLGQVVLESRPDPVIRAYEPHDIVLSSTEMYRGTMTLSDVLMAQPGMDIYAGRLYVKGAPVKIFVDGSPAMTPGLFSK